MNLDRALVGIAVVLFAVAVIAGGGPVTAVGFVLGAGLILVAAWRHGSSRRGPWVDGGGASGAFLDDGDQGTGHHGAHHGHGDLGGGGHFGGGHFGGGGGHH